MIQKALLWSVLWLAARDIRRDCLIVFCADGWHFHRRPL